MTIAVSKPDWLNAAEEEAWVEVQRILNDQSSSVNLARYADDPISFGNEVLGEIYTDDVQRVMTSVRDNPVTLARSATGPGKSHGAAAVAVWFYRVFDDAQVYMTAAPPLENLRRILWGEVMRRVKMHPNLFAGDKINRFLIARNDNSFISGVAIPTSGTSEEREAKFSGKHAPHILFIVDEGDAVPDEVYKGIEGCMSGGFARLLIMFNPKARAGSCYLKEVNGQAHVVHISAFNHPNVVSGTQLIKGAVDREVVVRRINEWTRELTSAEKVTSDCFEVPAFLIGSIATTPNGGKYPPLVGGYRKILNPSFSYMVLGNYPDAGEQQLIAETWIENARARYEAYVSMHGDMPPEGIQPIMGLDLAEYGADNSGVCRRYGGYVPPLIMWGNVDVDASAMRAYEIYQLYNARIIYVDATGVGAGTAPAMARRARDERFDGMRAIGIKVSNAPSRTIVSDLGEFFQLRDQLWWAVREWLRKDEGAMLPNDPMLIEELRVPKYSITQNGKIRITSKDEVRKLLKRSPDRADALCLTFNPSSEPTILTLADSQLESVYAEERV